MFLVLALLSSTVEASEIGQDPTKPLSWLQPSSPVKAKVVKKRQYFPSLQAITCNDSTECNAVLDNQAMIKGDKISGYVLLSINEESVLIGRSGKQWHLSLFLQDIKN